ncbi:MAG: Fic family protein [Armatimonadetes bacterium]|nr:Fic family protein [Armatimonadota bacterium]
MSDALTDLSEQANRAVGRLDGLSLLLPDISLFLYFYIRKEAVLSSQIEGTQSSLSDLLLFEFEEVPGVPIDDVTKVSNYVAALDFGLKRIRTDGFPLSSRLLREIHEVLLSKGRGSTKEPGQFRRSQNWIGGSRPGNAAYVPPPFELVPECIGSLENFLHDVPTRTPTLIKAALAHVQFETIHPFLDGNGRVGRLLITLLLCAEGALQDPLLYLSYYFKQNRARYYELLDRVRFHGDWEEWLAFFLTGVRDVAEQAAAAAQKILARFDLDRRAIATLGRQSPSAIRVHQYMEKHALLTIRKAADELHVTHPTVLQGVKLLQGLGIVSEITGRQRDRIFTYTAYLKLLEEGTKP